jgi:hypothetical protein
VAIGEAQAFGCAHCQWHTLAKHVLPFPCTGEPRPGRSTCAKHAAELDLMLFELAHGARCSWVIHWAAGSKLTRRCSAGEVAALLLEREPDGLLESSKDRRAMELRVHGRLVALVQREDLTK